jgi:hypothetical protein
VVHGTPRHGSASSLDRHGRFVALAVLGRRVSLTRRLQELTRRMETHLPRYHERAMMRLRGSAATAALGALLATSAARAGEIPSAVVILEAPPGTPGSEPSGAPPRFVLLKDGEVFVGGTGRLDTGRLEKSEVQALRRGADAVRKAAGREGTLWLGGDEHRAMRLRLPEDEARAITLTGDPSAAPPALRPIAAFVATLLSFDHPSLTRYAPASYALSAREGQLAGGCRAWRFPFAIGAAVAAARVVPAAEADGWPTGAWPASVCVDDKRYVVTLRPLLPGEQP